MIIKEQKLWGEKNFAKITCYLQEPSPELRGRAIKPAIIICPGGAYLGTSDREAEPIALRFASMGYQAIVLRYNTYFEKFGDDEQNVEEVRENCLWPQPLFDLGKTIVTVKENAKEWFIDPEQIFICGFSAGGNLVGNMSTQWHREFLSKKLNTTPNKLKVKGAIFGYPVLDYHLMHKLLDSKNIEEYKSLHKDAVIASFGTMEPTDEQLDSISPIVFVDEKSLPSFIWHTRNDDLVYVENSLNYCLELSKYDIDYELHIFSDGPHGLSLADETTSSNDDLINKPCQVWVSLAKTWMDRV